MIRVRRSLSLLVLPLALASFAACGDDGGTGGGGGSAGSSLTDADLQAAVDGYAALVAAGYAESSSRADALSAALDAFVAAPSPTTLDAAKTAWNEARVPYLQTEVFRFYGGPIDDEATGPEGRINGWPLDEVYIDYVEGVPMGGIINDPAGYPTIDETTIRDANEVGGEKNLSAGFHAVEFLLWGQDQSTTGPGARPHTDYLPEAMGGTAPNPDRRGTYLVAAGTLLASDLAFVTEAWKADADNYRAAFVADDPRASLSKILTGMGSLSGAELTSERMYNAYAERDQEEEHSCFSDTTHQDHLNDLIGIENAYLGDGFGVQGAGIDELVKKVDPALDETMKQRLSAAKAAIEAIPRPFDQAIADDAPDGGRAKIEAAMEALTALTETIVDVAAALDVQINLE